MTNLFRRKEREFALRRVKDLKVRFPEAEDILRFTECILEYQNSVLERIGEPDLDLSNAETRIKKGKPALKLKGKDLKPYLPYLKDLLDKASSCGTREIEEGASYLRDLEEEEVLSLVDYFLENQMADDVSRMMFCAWIQPIVYRISEKVTFNRDSWLKNFCPVCGFKPSVSFLMDSEEGEGVRFLRCSLCLTDWVYVRTMCVNCGNNEDDKIDYFVEKDIDYIHLQVCRRCEHYIKVVDLRKDGLAVPDLEDIATVTLDLWASERGYMKIEKNLFGY